MEEIGIKIRNLIRFSFFLFLTISAGAATRDQWFTTNSVAGIAAPADGWALVWSNGIPAWSRNLGLATNGPVGPAGPAGTNGLNGVNGTNGVNGINGTNGVDGVNGTNGLNGVNGTNGLNGVNGTNGIVATTNSQFALSFIEATSATDAKWTQNGNDLTNLNLTDATNNDLRISNILYLDIVGSTNGALALATNNDTVVSNGLYSQIVGSTNSNGQFVLTNESRNLVFTSPSNSLGQNVSASTFWATSASTLPITNTTLGLVNWLKFDDNVGITAVDSLDSANGTFVGDVTWTTGKINSAIQLSTSVGWVQLSTNLSVGDGAFSVSAWVNIAGTNSTGAIIWDSDDDSAGFTLKMGLGEPDMQIFVTGLYPERVSNAPLPIGQWVYVVATWDGSLNATGIHIYTNGVETGYSISFNGTGTHVANTSTNRFIGVTTGFSPFNGKIDDARAWSRVLSAGEITNMYQWRPNPGFIGEGSQITGLTNFLDTIVDVNSKILSATNNALTLATNNDLLIGLNGTNNVMAASNTLWISASNLVYQGTNVSISKKVSTNESRSLVFTSSTNRLGTNINADFFWGDISHGTGLTAGQIPNIAESQVTGLQGDLDARVTTNTSRSLVWTSSTNNLGTNVSAVTFYGALNGNATTATTATSATTATYVTGNNAALTNHMPIANVDSPGVIVTNGGTTAITYSNAFKLDAAHALSLSNIAASKILRTAADSTVAAVTIGSGVAFDGTTLTATGSGGTVTSVGVAGANGLTVSGSPVSGSGTITVGAMSDILTNNLAFAAVISNTIKMDASHALSLSNATASHVLQVGADSTVTSVSSGAVPIDGDGTATTSAQVNSLFPSNILTNNNANATVFSNTMKFDAAHALSLSNATASHVLQVGADSTVTSVSSGAVPIDGDGSATTAVQVNALFPSNIVTNNYANALVLSNTVKLDVAHSLSLSNATASHVLQVGADSTVSSVSSGAVPIDGNGSATTFPQVNALASADILTNNLAFAVVVSNTIKMDVSHALSLSNATASHVLQVGADSTVTSVSSGAVPIDGNGSATTFAQVNALASADILTNNLSFATVISNTLKMDAAHALSLSNATASHVLKVGADSTVTSVASGAVPIDGDGTATTFAQVNALAADILTNGTTLSVTFSNNTAVDAAHTLTANGPLTVGGVSTVVDVVGSGTNALNITAATNNVVWKVANYSLLANDTFVFISGNHTTTMPDPTAKSCYGKWFYINVSSAGTNAILPNGAETFNGSSGTALAKLTNTAVGKLISLYSNRTNWWYVINP